MSPEKGASSPAEDPVESHIPCIRQYVMNLGLPPAPTRPVDHPPSPCRITAPPLHFLPRFGNAVCFTALTPLYCTHRFFATPTPPLPLQCCAPARPYNAWGCRLRVEWNRVSGLGGRFQRWRERERTASSEGAKRYRGDGVSTAAR